MEQVVEHAAQHRKRNFNNHHHNHNNNNLCATCNNFHVYGFFSCKTFTLSKCQLYYCSIIDIYQQFGRDINCQKPADECHECEVHSPSSYEMAYSCMCQDRVVRVQRYVIPCVSVQISIYIVFFNVSLKIISTYDGLDHWDPAQAYYAIYKERHMCEFYLI